MHGAGGAGAPSTAIVPATRGCTIPFTPHIDGSGTGMCGSGTGMMPPQQAPRQDHQDVNVRPSESDTAAKARK